MQTCLTVITRASNLKESLLSKPFPMKGELKVEVSTGSPWKMGMELPFPMKGKDMQVAQAEVFHVRWEVQGSMDLFVQHLKA